MNKTKLELCTECLQVFVEYTIEGTGVEATKLLTDKRETFIEGGEVLGAMMSGYCLARGVSMAELEQSSPKLEDVIDNLTKQYQES
jgi:hypothetical protein